jgi:acetyl-CoA acyltransferase
MLTAIIPATAKVLQRAGLRLQDIDLFEVNEATLVNAMGQRGARYGLQTMCEAGGLANATIVQAL